MREVLGKKLSKGTKKDLDDISIKTGVTLKSCRRQVAPPPSSPESSPPPQMILCCESLGRGLVLDVIGASCLYPLAPSHSFDLERKRGFEPNRKCGGGETVGLERLEYGGEESRWFLRTAWERTSPSIQVSLVQPPGFLAS